MKKTAASLGSMLVKSKRASLGNPYGTTTKCGHGNCQCDVVSKKDSVIDRNENIIKTAKGICSNRCVSSTIVAVPFAKKPTLANPHND